VLAPVEALQLQAHQWNIELDPARLRSLSLYADLLANYNLANVIGTRERDKIVLDHLIDALSCYLLEDVHCRSSLIDVGSGAGLPGIPLSIIRPELKVTLLEATQKKVRFLQYAREILCLPNVNVLHGRAEEVARTEYRGTFELATARALAALPVLLEYCGPLVGVGGLIIAMKGHLPEEELSQGVTAAGTLRLKLRDVRQVEFCSQLPPKERSLAVFYKSAVTPSSFPRRPGLAKKRPLGT
jgi:16S rRNA (guanine527-N7)-methyltransferase